MRSHLTVVGKPVLTKVIYITAIEPTEMIRKLLLCLLFISFYHSPSNAVGKICYPGVGCYKNGSPWSNLRRPVLPPEDPKITQPFLTFYSRKSRDGVALDVYPEANFKNVSLNSKKDSYFIIHGYTDNGKLPWIMRLKNILLDKQDVNVFVPDYSKGAAGKYIQAVGNIRVNGKLFARAFNKTGIPSSRLHIIGHSLGAQLASYISNELNNMGQRVSWITALDPAEPLFETYDKHVRLDSSDADFIDAHHTNAGIRGMIIPCGHVDFYYNGGIRQPRCDMHNEFSGMASCYHHMAHEYYTSAVENECLYGLPSNLKPKVRLILSDLKRTKLTEFHQHSCYPHSCIPIGLKTKSSPLRGIFTVLPSEYPPYCSKLNPLLS